MQTPSTTNARRYLKRWTDPGAGRGKRQTTPSTNDRMSSTCRSSISSSAFVLEFITTMLSVVNHSNVTPTSLQRHSNVTPTSLQRHSNVTPTSLQVTPTSLQRHSNVDAPYPLRSEERRVGKS